MNYNVNFGMWNSIFAVPTSLIDNHIKFCSETQLKVLLLALRNSQITIQPSQIAVTIGVTVQDVEEALNYWHNSNILTQISQPAPQPISPPVTETVPIQKTQAAKPAVPMPNISKNYSSPNTQTVTTVNQVTKQKVTTVQSVNKLTPSQINKLMLEDKNIPIIIQTFQGLTGKLLSPGEQETVIHLYQYYSLSPEFMMIVLGFCVEQGKTAIPYFSKVLTNWIDRGIVDYDQAENYIQNLSKMSKNEELIKTHFDIVDKKLSSKDKEFIDTWFSTYNFSLDMILKAYEISLDKTEHISLNYINGILSQWYQKNIFTLEQIPTFSTAEENKGNKKILIGSSDASYDINDIDKILEMNLDD